MNEDKNIRVPRINVVVLSGRLVRDAEKRVNDKGVGFLTFRMASDQAYMENGVWKSRPLYIDVIYTNGDLVKLDDTKGRLLKGTPVVVEGRLVYREAERDGKRVERYYIKANRIDILEIRAKKPFSDLDEDVGLPPDDEIPF
jgi:single-stranded DNA-binding protein